MNSTPGWEQAVQVAAVLGGAVVMAHVGGGLVATPRQVDGVRIVGSDREDVVLAPGGADDQVVALGAEVLEGGLELGSGRHVLHVGGLDPVHVGDEVLATVLVRLVPPAVVDLAVIYERDPQWLLGSSGGGGRRRRRRGSRGGRLIRLVAPARTGNQRQRKEREGHRPELPHIEPPDSAYESMILLDDINTGHRPGGAQRLLRPRNGRSAIVGGARIHQGSGCASRAPTYR